MHLIGTGFTVAAVIGLAILARAVFVYVSPERECRRCRNRRKGRRCWRCKGTRRTWRLGAKQVHHVRLALQQAWDERGST
jgi:hypothetical protein